MLFSRREEGKDEHPAKESCSGAHREVMCDIKMRKHFWRASSRFELRSHNAKRLNRDIPTMFYWPPRTDSIQYERYGRAFSNCEFLHPGAFIRRYQRCSYRYAAALTSFTIYPFFPSFLSYLSCCLLSNRIKWKQDSIMHNLQIILFNLHLETYKKSFLYTKS